MAASYSSNVPGGSAIPGVPGISEVPNGNIVPGVPGLPYGPVLASVHPPMAAPRAVQPNSQAGPLAPSALLGQGALSAPSAARLPVPTDSSSAKSSPATSANDDPAVMATLGLMNLFAEAVLKELPGLKVLDQPVTNQMILTALTKQFSGLVNTVQDATTEVDPMVGTGIGISGPPVQAKIRKTTATKTAKKAEQSAKKTEQLVIPHDNPPLVEVPGIKGLYFPYRSGSCWWRFTRSTDIGKHNRQCGMGIVEGVYCKLCMVKKNSKPILKQIEARGGIKTISAMEQDYSGQRIPTVNPIPWPSNQGVSAVSQPNDQRISAVSQPNGQRIQVVNRPSEPTTGWTLNINPYPNPKGSLFRSDEGIIFVVKINPDGTPGANVAIGNDVSKTGFISPICDDYRQRLTGITSAVIDDSLARQYATHGGLPADIATNILTVNDEGRLVQLDQGPSAQISSQVPATQVSDQVPPSAVTPMANNIPEVPSVVQTKVAADSQSTMGSMNPNPLGPASVPTSAGPPTSIPASATNPLAVTTAMDSAHPPLANGYPSVPTQEATV